MVESRISVSFSLLLVRMVPPSLNSVIRQHATVNLKAPCKRSRNERKNPQIKSNLRSRRFMLAHKGTDAIALRAQVGVHEQFPARPDQGRRGSRGNADL